MEVKQRGTAFGHKIILFLYKIFGYKLVYFILNFVALYYVLFTPSVKKSLKSYYEAQNIQLTYKEYFKHIKMFAVSIFDRFISRIEPDEFKFDIQNDRYIQTLQEGGIVLLSHVGSWATASNALGKRFPTMNVVMRENTKQDINRVENYKQRSNEEIVKIIDLNQGAIASNIQIANALMSNELVALMSDRVMDERYGIKVRFFDRDVIMNKNPFDIALRTKKPIVAIFVMNTGIKQYNLSLYLVENSSIEKMAQNYADLLENIMKKYPNQWYNFYNYFKEKTI